ncbi:MAG: hypothetical protein AABY26_02280, partial [Nanoarchaeota archaeon]
MSEENEGGAAPIGEPVRTAHVEEAEVQEEAVVYDIGTLKRERAGRRSAADKSISAFKRVFKGERTTLEDRAKELDQVDPEIQKLGVPGLKYCPKSMQRAYVWMVNQVPGYSIEDRFGKVKKVLETYVHETTEEVHTAVQSKEELEQTLDSLAEQRRLSVDAVNDTVSDAGEVRDEQKKVKSMLNGNTLESKERGEYSKLIREYDRDISDSKYKQDELLVDMIAIDSRIGAAKQQIAAQEYKIDEARKGALNAELILNQYILADGQVELGDLFSKVIPKMGIAAEEVKVMGKALQKYQTRKMEKVFRLRGSPVTLPDPSSQTYTPFERNQEEREEW